MICRECSKELNEMTLVCDSCGATILYEKPQLDESEFLNKIIIKKDFDKYSKELKVVIRNAYYFANIRNDYKGSSKKYLDKYIEFAFIRIYYEENKLMLLTRDFPKETSLTIYETLVTKRIGKEMNKIMLDIYEDDYKYKKLPPYITNRVGKVYIPKFNMSRISSGKLFRNSFITITKEVIKYSIVFIIIGLTILLASTFSSTTEVIYDTIIEFDYSIYLVLILGLIAGTYLGNKKISNFPIRDTINLDVNFKKHIKVEAEKKLKTIKYRIKKGR